MVRHTLKIVQQDFWSVSDHFGTLYIKGLKKYWDAGSGYIFYYLLFTVSNLLYIFCDKIHDILGFIQALTRSSCHFFSEIQK